MTTTIPRALIERTERTPDDPFVRCGGDWLSYAEVELVASRLAGGLRSLGLERGDRVATLLPTQQVVIELFFATMHLGLVSVPYNAYLKGEFLRHQFDESEPAAIVVDRPGFEAVLPLLPASMIHTVIVTEPVDVSRCDRRVVGLDELGVADPVPPVNVAPGDLAAISYTSGTTGLPKGCMISHGYYTSIPRLYDQAHLFDPGDRLFASMPCYHLGGVSILMMGLMQPISVRLEPTFSASTFMATAAADSCTILWGTGMMAMAILAQSPDPSNASHPVRRALWVPMAVADQEVFERRFGCKVFGSYGQSEFLVIAVEEPHGATRRSAGRPVPSVELRIVDANDDEVAPGQSGEIAVRSKVPHGMFDGYWRNPEATTRAWRHLWHHTGDLGRLDEAGEVRFVDRAKDAIRRRGENVSSQEVEAALKLHPAIAQVAAYPVPAKETEDDIMVSLVLDGSLSPSSLFDYMRGNVPYFAIPRYVLVREAFPVTESGKVLKRLMRDEGVTPDTWDLTEMGLVVDRQDRR